MPLLKLFAYLEFSIGIVSLFFSNELKFADMTELHINIGNGKITANQVVNSIYADTKTKQEMVLDRVTNSSEKKIAVKGDIVVENISDIKINVAGCCKPIPGDDIVGYISRGNGINVHRTVCPDISELEERIIEVKWNDKITKKYETKHISNV